MLPVNIKKAKDSYLESIFYRTMVLDIHRQKDAGKLKGYTPEEQYQYYKNILLKDPVYTRALGEEFPELTRLIQQNEQQKKGLEQEIRSRLKKDGRELAGLLESGFSELIAREIDISAGDAHNGGYRTAKVVLEQGTTLYYKPHSIRKAQWYQELYGYLCQKAGIAYKKVKYLNREKYGWEEYIVNKGCETKEEIKRYYFRLGIHLCISYALSATDLHGENIIAHGEHPVIVDFETFPGYCIKIEESSAERKAETILSHSVIHTGMLPILTWGQGENMALLSAVGNEGKITTPFRMPVVKKNQTSDMYIDYEPVEVIMRECVVHLHGKPIHVEEYTKELVHGFQTAYHIMLEDCALEKLVEKFFDEKSRVVLRHTQQYEMYRTASLHPDYMKSREDRVKLLQAIHKDGESELDRRIRDYEIEALAELDVPYFEISGKNRDIYAGNDLRFREFLDACPYEQWKMHWKSFSVEDMKRQTDFIRLSMAMLGEKNYDVKILDGNRIDKKRIVPILRGIVSRLCENVIITECSDITWIGLKFLKNGCWELHPVDMYLYEGISGIVLFLGEYLQMFRDAGAERCFRLAVKKMRNYTEGYCRTLKSEQQVKTGLLDGEASLVYVYLQLYRMSGDVEHLEYAQKHFLGMKSYFKDDVYYDLLSGNAGAMAVAAELYRVTGQEKYLEDAEKLEKMLWEKRCEQEKGVGWKLPNIEQPLAGMAHGNSGFLLAYVCLYQIAKRPEYINKIHQILTYEDLLYNEKLKNWMDLRVPGKEKTMNAWCHGAPGILLARLKIRAFIPDENVEKDICRGAGMLLGEEIQKICLCHGLAGNLLILDKYRRENIEICVKDAYEKKWNHLICMLEQPDTVSVTEYLNPAFMNGISGVGFALLRLLGSEAELLFF